jgi:hypothetical protein
MSKPARRRWRSSRPIVAFFAIEFLDELVFGASEAAWPLIRDDLGHYLQIGVLLSPPDHRQPDRAVPGHPGDTWAAS